MEETIKKFNFKEFEEKLDSLKDLNVFIIGDCVIDQYVFVEAKGRAMKDPIISTRFKKEENYAGGVLAVVNHISSYVDKPNLVTLIGEQDSKLKFIENSLAKNIELKTFIKENSPTTVKKRYIILNKKCYETVFFISYKFKYTPHIVFKRYIITFNTINI